MEKYPKKQKQGGRNMKKVLAVVLASAMAMSLTACSSQKPAETAAATVAETQAETKEAAEETAAPESAAAEVTDLKGKMMGVVTPAADHGFTAESIQHCEAEVKLLAESTDLITNS